MLLSTQLLASLASDVTSVASLRSAGDGYRCAVRRVDVDPLEFVRAAAPVFGSARYLATADGLTIGGVGVAWRAEASGERRFQQLDAAFAGAPSLPPEARLLLGYAFSPDGPKGEEWEGFPAAEAVLPLATVVASGDTTHLVLAVPPGAEPNGLLGALRSLQRLPEPSVPGLGDHWVHAAPSGADWCDAVGEAVEAIRADALRKVVLARSVVVRTEMTIDPFEVVHHLADRTAHTHVYGWQIGDTSFVGASPELLVGLRARELRASPLAGSARRGEGDAEDRVVGEALLSSTKNRQEHGLVVDDIAARLRPVTTRLKVPDLPVLHRVATVQHLMTEIEGTVADGVSLFEIGGRLHPTPAVGGTPRREAMAFIDKVEGMDRGWYTGGVGWIGPDGDGDIAIALRCGLVSGSEARLYAGNGIVADSEPEAELIETRWKLRPLFNLLTAT
jgi:isochorismate synthase